MFNKGDKFILFTKYGGVIKGEVDSTWKTVVADYVNLCFYDKEYMKTTTGVIYNTNGSEGIFHKIQREISPEVAALASEKLKNLKRQYRNK